MDIFADYFGEFSDQRIRDNYVIVYEVKTSNSIELAIRRANVMLSVCRVACLPLTTSALWYVFSTVKLHWECLCVRC